MEVWGREVQRPAGLVPSHETNIPLVGFDSTNLGLLTFDRSSFLVCFVPQVLIRISIVILLDFRESKDLI